jgi:hypothetical protein
MKNTRNFIYVFFALVLNMWTVKANALEHLCDRWNVIMDSGFELGPIYGEIWTNGYKMQGDTIINNRQYSCLLFADGHQNSQSENWEWVYYGAIRETANTEIYFIPAGQSKEYQLFAFNAQVGDKIDNLYVMNNNYPAWAIVKKVSEKEIILDLYEQLDEEENVFWHDYVWVKGVGSKRAMFQPLPNGGVGGCVINFLSSAYNGDVQIYTSKAENIPAQATKWYGIRYFHDYPYEEHAPVITNLTYSLEGDTLIKDKQYRQIRCYTNESEHITAYRGAIRQSEDRQQVYFVPWGSQTEYLLYDFSVKKGDTVYAYAGFHDISCVKLLEDDPERTITPAWIVMDVQTIDSRKHIFVQNDLSNTFEWIEGIGTRYILWYKARTCYATGMDIQYQHTLCATDSDGNVLYSFDTDYLGFHNNNCQWEPMAIENTASPSLSTTKFLRDGQLFIRRDDKTYTIHGTEIK